MDHEEFGQRAMAAARVSAVKIGRGWVGPCDWLFVWACFDLPVLGRAIGFVKRMLLRLRLLLILRLETELDIFISLPLHGS